MRGSLRISAGKLLVTNSRIKLHRTIPQLRTISFLKYITSTFIISVTKRVAEGSYNISNTTGQVAVRGVSIKAVYQGLLLPYNLLPLSSLQAGSQIWVFPYQVADIGRDLGGPRGPPYLRVKKYTQRKEKQAGVHIHTRTKLPLISSKSGSATVTALYPGTTASYTFPVAYGKSF